MITHAATHEVLKLQYLVKVEESRKNPAYVHLALGLQSINLL